MTHHKEGAPPPSPDPQTLASNSPERGDRWGCCSGVTDMLWAPDADWIAQLAFSARHKDSGRKQLPPVFAVFQIKARGWSGGCQLDVVQFSKTPKNPR